MRQQLEQTVLRAVEDLPPELRDAITFREVEGMSYEEIAERMDCPIGTVRSRIFRAREAIAAWPARKGRPIPRRGRAASTDRRHRGAV